MRKIKRRIKKRMLKKIASVVTTIPFAVSLLHISENHKGCLSPGDCPEKYLMGLEQPHIELLLSINDPFYTLSGNIFEAPGLSANSIEESIELMIPPFKS